MFLTVFHHLINKWVWYMGLFPHCCSISYTSLFWFVTCFWQNQWHKAVYSCFLIIVLRGKLCVVSERDDSSYLAMWGESQTRARVCSLFCHPCEWVCWQQQGRRWRRQLASFHKWQHLPHEHGTVGCAEAIPHSVFINSVHFLCRQRLLLCNTLPCKTHVAY